MYTHAENCTDKYYAPKKSKTTNPPYLDTQQPDPSPTSDPNDDLSIHIKSKNSVIPTPKKRRPRCAHISCSNKITIIELDMKCECNLSFCSRHRLPEYHMCTYNHATEAKAIVKQQIMASAHTKNKIDKI